MEMAIFFEVRAVLLENVVQLVDDDGDHHLLSQADEVALEFGYSRVHVWHCKHSSCGGGSQGMGSAGASLASLQCGAETGANDGLATRSGSIFSAGVSCANG